MLKMEIATPEMQIWTDLQRCAKMEQLTDKPEDVTKSLAHGIDLKLKIKNIFINQ